MSEGRVWSLNTRIGFIGINIYKWGLMLWIETGPDKTHPLRKVWH